MNSVIQKTVLTAVAVVAMAVSSQAVLINGDIAFAGKNTVDNGNFTLATKFLSFSSVEVEDASGDYAGTAGEAATFSPFAFDGSESTPFTLWSFTVGLTTYEFSATDVSISFVNANNLVIEGNGFASITGFDDTTGFWNVTANKAGTAFSFSSSAVTTGAPTGVPDGGVTASLLGFALAGVAFVRRLIQA